MSCNYYQPSNHQFPYYGNTMIPNSYQKVESLYPDYSIGARVENDCGCPGAVLSNRKLYNLNPNVQINPYLDKCYVYEQAAENNATSKIQEKDTREYIEKILKKNTEVWKHYLSGRFDVLSCLENGCKRIILKEKVANKKITDTSGYDIKKFRVRLSHHRKAKKNDEILLVTYGDQIKKSFSRSKSYAQTVSYSKCVIQSKNDRSNSCSSFESTGEYLCEPEGIPGVAGPGSELIAKLIEGDDEDIADIMNPPREEPIVEESGDPDLVGNYFLDSNDNQQNEATNPLEEISQTDVDPVTDPTIDYEAYNNEENYEQQVPEEEYDQNYLQEQNVDSFDEEYIDQFAPTEEAKLDPIKTASKQESLSSRGKNDRLTGSVKKALHVFREYDEDYSSQKTTSKTLSRVSKTTKSTEVEVYNLSPLPENKQRSIKSETPSSLASSKLTHRSNGTNIAKRLFSNNSANVTPAPSNPFAFNSNSPVSQSQYIDALTGITDERQTPVYAESIGSKQSRNSRQTKSSYRHSILEEEDEEESTYTEQPQQLSTGYDYESEQKKTKNGKKGSSAFSEYQENKSRSSRKHKN